MTTSTIITALTDLTCDAYTVTATDRGNTIVVSYYTTDADLAQTEADGADASAPTAAVALANDPERATLVADMDDEEIALCIHNATALDADILAREDGAHDTDREYVAAYATAHLARYGEVWTLP